MNNLPVIGREPAALAGAVIAVLNVLQVLGVINLTADALGAINTALIAVLTLFVRATSTPTAAPVLAAGSEVSVKGSQDKVTIQATPPGPTGIDAGVGP